MNKLEQAARQALNYLAWLIEGDESVPNITTGIEAITALREALADQAEGVIVKICPDGYGTITTEQAEQEPEVWYCPDCGTLSETQAKCCPDWIRSRKVPKNFALTCKATFDRNGQADQEPLMITPGGGAFPFAVVGELEQAEQEPCKECGAKQAQIDRLMLEYCPDEMTPEQMQEWGNNQRPVEQAEQEPVLCVECGKPTMHMGNKCYACCQKDTKDLEDALKSWDAAPVRTKDPCNPLQDLTDDEIAEAVGSPLDEVYLADFRAAIAADREKNK